jgi:predicted nucleic acid-binding protein
LKIYADSSFLVSLYGADANWVAAARIMETSTGEFLITTLCEPEVVNAFGLRVIRKEVSAAQAQSSVIDFEKDLRDGIFQLRGLSDPIFERARLMSRQTTAKLGARTADLLHVAAALELGADYLYSFDQQQRKLAQSVRLKLNSHSRDWPEFSVVHPAFVPAPARAALARVQSRSSHPARV